MPLSRLIADPSHRRGLFLLVLLTVIWGVNWPVMKIAATEIPPWTFRTVTSPISGAGLLLIAWLAKRSLRVPPGRWRWLILAAFFNVTCWHMLTAYGVTMMASGHASVIAFTMPIWAALLGLLVMGEKISGRVFAALAFGMAGVWVLVAGRLFVPGGDPWGLAVMLGAAIAWAAGTIVLKRTDWRMPAMALAGWQLLLGGLPIIPVAAINEFPHLEPVSYAATAAVIYIIIGPQIFCYYAWNTIVGIFPVNVSSISTLMIPVLGVISGGLVLGEAIGLREACALVLVCAALGLVLFRR
ncbi:MAG: DMT family transporter [Rhodospirillales bacterium]|nr:DMT family transporter [Rhodospirillales bacterium]